jgi:hypothetical protein
MAAHDLLNKVQGLKKVGRERWIARCPSHADKSPSLAIRELSDGRVLLKCFAGCEALEVLNAVGLEFRDLMPEKLVDYKRERKPFYDSDLLLIIRDEARVVYLSALHLSKGNLLSDVNLRRLALAAQRIAYSIGV